MNDSPVIARFRDLGRSGLGVPIMLLILLSMMVVPLPPFLLDVLFTFNIALSLVVILAAIYTRKPLDLAVFPTVLLIATLLRLGLNIASTRVVLMEGHTGTDAAGHVIESFGEFVVGGNYAVGLVVFAILVVINFVVVTKGAGRISEVSARFTLDAMPGKQMAIDADLNAGSISQEEAKIRRAEVVREADFYGAMDGSSKFVRGDAIAGILVLFINLIGGLAIGLLQHDMAFSDALKNYTLLTIGDGLVAQIPALVLSTAAAIMVTRVSSAQDMSGQIVTQLFENPRTLNVTAGVMTVLGIVPGMPNVAFLSMAALLVGAAYLVRSRQQAQLAALETAPSPVAEALPPETRELSWDDVVPIDMIGLEVGYRLIPLVDKAQGGQLMSRIKGVRKKLTQDLGFLIPAVHIRDNLELPPTGYRLSLLGVNMGETQIYPDREMAINPGQVFGTVQGIAAKDPAFGLEAVWIDPSQRDHAQSLGYTVVDASTVVATHLSHLLQTHAHELLGTQEVQQLMENLRKTHPKLVDSLAPEILPVGIITRVLQNLLEEGIPIRDIRTIAETLAEHASKSQDPTVLTSLTRIALGRLIVQQINGMSPELAVIALDPSLEQLLQDALQMPGGLMGLEPGLAERIQRSIAQSAQRQEMTGQVPVLLTSAPLRTAFARWLRQSVQGLKVLSYNEIPDDKRLRIIASIGK